MAFRSFIIGGVDKSDLVQPGWTIEATANGRDTLECDVLSADGSYVPALDAQVLVNEAVAILSSSAANPTTITTDEAHGLTNGQTVEIAGHSVGGVNGDWTSTVVSATTFTIPVASTGGGATGVAARRLFAGANDEPETTGLGGFGVQAVTTKVAASDLNAKAERRYVKAVLPAGTLKSQLLVIASVLGLTIHPAQPNGPAMPEQAADYMLLRTLLDQLTVSSAGWIWEFDGFGYLRMFAPVSEAAPVNVIDGNGVAVGDIKVKPTRNGYANRVILRFSDAARASYGFLGTTGNFANGEQVTLGSKTYTLQTVLTNSDGNVAIGAHAVDSLHNLVAAITLGAGSGTAYAAAMTVHPQASAYLFSGSSLIATALTAGAAGNSIAVSETSANASWFGEGGVPLTTLQLGVDQALTNVVISEDLVEQGLHDIWEVVIQAPDTTNPADAQTLADNYKAIKLLAPKQVTYETYALGLRPGQTQTIQVATRGVNNLFMITDVKHPHREGALVRRVVTAIESLLLPSSPRWRELYKQWSAGGGGASSAGTVVSSGGSSSSVPTVYFLGGSLTDRVSSPTPDWVPASAVQIRIDTTVRGTTSGVVYVRVRAFAGTVTARLRNVTDGSTVGTSTAAAAGGWVSLSFAVSLTPGAKFYEVQLLPSVANSDVQLGSAYME